MLLEYISTEIVLRSSSDMDLRGLIWGTAMGFLCTVIIAASLKIMQRYIVHKKHVQLREPSRSQLLRIQDVHHFMSFFLGFWLIVVLPFTPNLINVLGIYSGPVFLGMFVIVKSFARILFGLIDRFMPHSDESASK
jgi:hypothetical protein